MIRTEPADALMVTTSAAHVQIVAKTHGLPVVPAGGYLYAVRRVPLLGQPIIYRTRVSS